MNLNIKQYADWIHITQLIALLVLGLLLFKPVVLSTLRIENAISISFWLLIVSLFWEHFIKK